MIDPNQLTKENGFAKGCVVEIVMEDGNKSVEYFDGVSDGNVLLIDIFGSWIMNENNKCQFIRPLTGSMAIWNFAPELATHCLQMTDDQGNIWVVSWYRDLVLDPLIPDDPDEIITNRPFWARSEK